VIDELVPAARHVLERYANNRVEADHGQLKARLRQMRGLKTIRSLRTIAAGHAFGQNLRRGHYELTVDVAAHDRVPVAFTALAPLPYSRPSARPGCNAAPDPATQHRCPARSMMPSYQSRRSRRHRSGVQAEHLTHVARRGEIHIQPAADSAHVTDKSLLAKSRIVGDRRGCSV
jgi:hypothetical protein